MSIDQRPSLCTCSAQLDRAHRQEARTCQFSRNICHSEDFVKHPVLFGLAVVDPNPMLSSKPTLHSCNVDECPLLPFVPPTSPINTTNLALSTVHEPLLTHLISNPPPQH